MKNNIIIVVATHKHRTLLDNKIFMPVQVGAVINSYTVDENYHKDNEGDHISEKNASFNELTALYWAWKNLDFEIVGLAHYRRYFDIFYKKPIFSKDKNHVVRNINNNDSRLIALKDINKTEKKIKKYLKNIDVILPLKAFCTLENGDFESISNQYKRFHHAKDWEICLAVLLEKYPEYKESINKYFDNGNVFYLCNMFISKKEWFDQYMTWLFDILFEVERKIVVSEDAFQKRVFGFLSERLFTLYILHKNFKIKELPILLVEE